MRLFVLAWFIISFLVLVAALIHHHKTMSPEEREAMKVALTPEEENLTVHADPGDTAP